MTTIPYLMKVTCADLDLKHYEGRWAIEHINSRQKYGKFVKFSFLDISTKKLYDDDLNNTAVRSEQNRDDWMNAFYQIKSQRYTPQRYRNFSNLHERNILFQRYTSF